MACSFTTGDRKSPAAGSSLSKIARKGLSIEKAGKSRQRSKKVMKLKPQISVKGTHVKGLSRISSSSTF